MNCRCYSVDEAPLQPPSMTNHTVMPPSDGGRMLSIAISYSLAKT